MTKYRKLNLEELQSLEKEFIDFLVINGITADDWVKIKEEEKEKAERIIELFSDVVFEDILRKTQFLQFRGKKEIYAYQCLEDKIVLVGLTAEAESKIDFSKDNLKDVINEQPDSIKIFTTEKLFSKNREEELFSMLQVGCEISSDGKLFKVLCMGLG